MNSRDSEKLSRLYELYEQPMYRIAYAVLKNSEAAEDAVSEAFLRIIGRLGRITDPESPKTKNFIIRLIKNASIDIYRKNRRCRIVEVSVDYETMNIPDGRCGIEELVLGESESISLESVLGRLGEPDRSIVTMRCCDELSWKEVAEKLSLTETTVRKRFERIRKKLTETKGESAL